MIATITRQRVGTVERALRIFMKLGLVDPFCPIFDNSAGLLRNTQMLPMDISPSDLISALRARPFNTTFTR